MEDGSASPLGRWVQHLLQQITASCAAALLLLLLLWHKAHVCTHFLPLTYPHTIHARHRVILDSHAPVEPGAPEAAAWQARMRTLLGGGKTQVCVSRGGHVFAAGAMRCSSF